MTGKEDSKGEVKIAFLVLIALVLLVMINAVAIIVSPIGMLITKNMHI